MSGSMMEKLYHMEQPEPAEPDDDYSAPQEQQISGSARHSIPAPSQVGEQSPILPSLHKAAQLDTQSACSVSGKTNKTPAGKLDQEKRLASIPDSMPKPACVFQEIKAMELEYRVECIEEGWQWKMAELDDRRMERMEACNMRLLER